MQIHNVNDISKDVELFGEELEQLIMFNSNLHSLTIHDCRIGILHIEESQLAGLTITDSYIRELTVYSTNIAAAGIVDSTLSEGGIYGSTFGKLTAYNTETENVVLAGDSSVEEATEVKRGYAYVTVKTVSPETGVVLVNRYIHSRTGQTRSTD
jgi:hypothetical protein